MNINEDFNLDAYEKAEKEQSLYPVDESCREIESVIDDSIIRLYHSIDNFIFQDIDYSRVISIMPQWIADGGISPELNCTKELYEKLRRKETHPIFGRFIYHYDLWSKVAAIQDRLSAVMMFMRQLYNIVPCTAKYGESQYTSAARCGGARETEAHILLNSVFLAYASVFDIMTKIAIEQFEFTKYNFSNYRKMKSADTIYKKSLNNIDPSLKTEGMLFSEPPIIRKIETFRNEFVHNGPWDLRCSVYNTAVDGEPADVIIYSPDMDEIGNFVSSGSRNKFYSQANRINIQLPNMIQEATIVLKNTIEQLSTLYQVSTIKSADRKYTEECLDAISNYYKELVVK
ncbi:hypothetical protein [Bacteroides fragilis]|uniref:hypothetical protein n=1 Tax=Bacteroides fragilis TaxID=817 RepID=UPI0028120103|nr:hypothetical protein [Bacteroides fragilis]WMI96725.1 hypothetical protein BFGS084_04180 [Bacteroides fragilis]